jgi:regulator of cell morphogenesis and NO signaling
MVSLLESSVVVEETPVTDDEGDAVAKEQLSQRERDVLMCVVKGMTNKEIADTLCISIHTVLTHRRNIAKKLEIHSPAGLVIYAIVNGIVKVEEIKDVISY